MNKLSKIKLEEEEKEFLDFGYPAHYKG